MKVSINACTASSHPLSYRFTARFDPATQLYLAVTNPSIDRYGANSDARNILALAYSKDLLSWRVAATLLVPNDGLPWDDSLWRTAYQYPGAPLLRASRMWAALWRTSCCAWPKKEKKERIRHGRGLRGPAGY